MTAGEGFDQVLLGFFRQGMLLQPLVQGGLDLRTNIATIDRTFFDLLQFIDEHRSAHLKSLRGFLPRMFEQLGQVFDQVLGQGIQGILMPGAPRPSLLQKM
jgi:hypothetical protein